MRGKNRYNKQIWAPISMTLWHENYRFNSHIDACSTIIFRKSENQMDANWKLLLLLSFFHVVHPPRTLIFPIFYSMAVAAAAAASTIHNNWAKDCRQPNTRCNKNSWHNELASCVDGAHTHTHTYKVNKFFFFFLNKENVWTHRFLCSPRRFWWSEVPVALHFGSNVPARHCIRSLQSERP